MRRVLILAGVVAGLAVPSTAAAQTEPVCPGSNGASYDYQAGLTLYAGTWWTGQEAHNPNGACRARRGERSARSTRASGSTRSGRA